MEYNELLNKIQGRMQNTSSSTTGPVQQSESDNTATLLNKIGLEIRREGGN